MGPMSHASSLGGGWGAGRPDQAGPRDTSEILAQHLVRGGYENTTARRIEFERRHPDVSITPPDQRSSSWTATYWVLDEKQNPKQITLTEPYCARLLDTLDERFDAS